MDLRPDIGYFLIHLTRDMTVGAMIRVEAGRSTLSILRLSHCGYSPQSVSTRPAVAVMGDFSTRISKQGLEVVATLSQTDLAATLIAHRLRPDVLLATAPKSGQATVFS